MKWIIEGSGGKREVEVEREGARFAVTIDGVRREIDYLALDSAVASLRYLDDGNSFHVTVHRDGKRNFLIAVGEREFQWKVMTPVEAVDSGSNGAAAGAAKIVAPIPGKVVSIGVGVGDTVEQGRPVVVLEAMKMENELEAERAGVVAAIHVAPGDTVDAGTVLVELKAEDDG